MQKWFDQGKDGRIHANVTEWEGFLEQLKQQFNNVGYTREEQVVSWKNIKWDGNEIPDLLSYRAIFLSKTLGLNIQHIWDTFKLKLPSNIYVNYLCKHNIHYSIYGNFIMTGCFSYVSKAWHT